MANESLSPQRIVLTGFMASGKSTIGPLLAKRLGWKFVDADTVIVEETGISIADFFAQHGEAAFRELEHKTIARLNTGDALVLALGGGAIEHQETRRLLLSSQGTLLAHLEVSLETTLARCKGTEETRPLLADKVTLAARYEHRLPLYRMAHLSVVTDALTPEQVVEAVIQAAQLSPQVR